MSKLGQLLKSTVPPANPANAANRANDKSHVPRANPANPDEGSGKISGFSNISRGVSENSLSPAALATRIRAMAERWQYSADELAEALAGAQVDPDQWQAWVTRDEATSLPDSRPALPLSSVQESAARQVLAQLKASPTVTRALVNRFNVDGTMVVTLAIRGVGTGELLIPADRLSQETLDDYGALLKCLEVSPNGR